MKIKQLCILFVLLPLFSQLISCQARNELSAEAKETEVKLFAESTLSLKGRLFSPTRAGDREVYLEREAKMENAEMSHAEPVPYREGQFGLKVKLTLKGRLRWVQTMAEYKGRRLIMMIGGKFKCYVIVGDKDAEENYLIGAPFSLEEAEEISRDIERNYAEMKEKS